MVAIRITSRCNMRCAHCCFSCEPGKGKDMPMRIFRRCMDFVSKNEESYTLSGGEPTLHKKWYEILGHAMTVSLGRHAYGSVITNGSIRDKSLFLAGIGSNTEYFDAALSWGDGYHDDSMVSKEVISAFEGHYRDNSSSIQATGRAAENCLETGEQTRSSCVCPAWVIDPNGDIYTCGCCRRILVGNVLSEWANLDKLDLHEGYCTGHYFREDEDTTSVRVCSHCGSQDTMVNSLSDEGLNTLCRTCGETTVKLPAGDK